MTDAHIGFVFRMNASAIWFRKRYGRIEYLLFLQAFVILCLANDKRDLGSNSSYGQVEALLIRFLSVSLNQF